MDIKQFILENGTCKIIPTRENTLPGKTRFYKYCRVQDGQPDRFFSLLKAKDIQAQMYPEWKKEKLVIISQIL